MDINKICRPQAVDIMYSRLASLHAKAEVVIRPQVGHIGSSDFSKRHEAILEGERAATEAIPTIKEILDRHFFIARSIS